MHLYFYLYIIENRSHDDISLNHRWDMSATMTTNGIRTHARTNQSLE